MGIKSYILRRIEWLMRDENRYRVMLRLRVAWGKYRQDQLTLADAAAIPGVLIKQFLQLGNRLERREFSAVPEALRKKANNEEEQLISLCNPSQIELLLRMLDTDLRFPAKMAFTNHVWQDLHLLLALSLVEVTRKAEMWHYRLNLGKGFRSFAKRIAAKLLGSYS